MIERREGETEREREIAWVCLERRDEEDERVRRRLPMSLIKLSLPVSMAAGGGMKMVMKWNDALFEFLCSIYVCAHIKLFPPGDFGSRPIFIVRLIGHVVGVEFQNGPIYCKSQPLRISGLMMWRISQNFEYLIWNVMNAVLQLQISFITFKNKYLILRWNQFLLDTIWGYLIW